MANLSKSKLAEKKRANFQILFDELVTSGRDFQLCEKQTEIWLYIEGENNFSLVLGLDGKWSVQ